MNFFHAMETINNLKGRSYKKPTTLPFVVVKYRCYLFING